MPASLPFRRLLLAAFVLTSAARTLAVDLSQAVVVAPKELSPREQKAVAMLVEEVEKRSHVRWPVAADAPAGKLAIHITPAAKKKADAKKAEGFQLKSTQDQITVSGNDERGTLFGIGYLLRQLRMAPGKVALADDLNIDTAPAYEMRGHQLGYRPKTNSYDAWDLPTWEQYYRDLAVFGCNAVELIPPRSDDAATSPHFPLPPLEMMVGMSKLADDYGLTVSIWYPAMDKDYSDPATVEAALKEWEGVYKALPRIDIIFVPGGDPGHTQPKYLFGLLEKQTALLKKYHPKAEMWMSPQGFTAEWMEEFFGLMQAEPKWLSGLVFGPQVRVSLPTLREKVPARYPIRHYPDITHSRQCQYPVPDWDVAHAVTSSRECINPRPNGQATIFRLLQPYTMGFLTYSEGCNDDLNKFVWSGLGWNPDAPVLDTLREFSRYFIGDEFADDFAQGLLNLERNWQGPLLTNDNVYVTLAQFQDIERRASPALKKNWRYQQALYRAYYDAYVRARLIRETALEQKAIERLRSAGEGETTAAMDDAEKILAEADTPVAAEWRKRVFELADDLFASIKMQTSVGKYQAISVDRGATLDNVDVALNNRQWIENRLAVLRQKESEAERLAGIAEIVNWTDPGPGGFYDDLGKRDSQPHLIRGLGFEKDPAFLKSSKIGFAGFGPMRSSWKDHGEAMLDEPLRMHYDGLDPAATYKMRIVYGGDGADKPVRCVASENIEIHPYIDKVKPVGPVEYAIPHEATKNGTLDLSWHGPRGRGGNGRNVQVSEIWIIKTNEGTND
jgi:hypothetical protein